MSNAMLLLFACILLSPREALGKTFTVAVIDTGIDAKSLKLCKRGHRSFVAALPNPLEDEHGHGTHVAGIIRKNAGDSQYCMVAIKFYSDQNTVEQNIRNMREAIQYAIDIRVNLINISGGGPDFDLLEYKTVERALDLNIKMVVAAGNDSVNLDYECNYFPACYDRRIVVVGNLELHTGIITSMTRSPSSNYGNVVTTWEVGTNILSTLPHGEHGYMSGTSQATAAATGHLIKEALRLR